MKLINNLKSTQKKINIKENREEKVNTVINNIEFEKKKESPRIIEIEQTSCRITKIDSTKLDYWLTIVYQ